MDPIRRRQSEVSRQGSRFEEYVKDFLIGKLTDEPDLKVVSQRELENNMRDSMVYNAVAIEVFHRGGVLRLPGDTDIVVYSERVMYPVVIVSCKLSLHGRLTESLFYAIYYRMFRKIKYVLVTVDKGRQSGSGRWESEWGTPENPSKDRLLAKLFLDGVYVKNLPEFMPVDFQPERHKTALGDIVKDLDELISDIKGWYKELL